MSEAKQRAGSKYAQFIDVIESRIADENGKGKNLPATSLAKEVGPTFGWDWPQAYQMINAYLDERTDLAVKKGPRGGIGPKDGFAVAVASSELKTEE